MLTSISFTVPGKARPKGSWRPMVSKTTGKVFVKPNSKDEQFWAGMVAHAAKEAIWKNGEAPPMDMPVSVVIQAFFDRPKSHYRTGKHADELRETSPLSCTSKPDIDKIARSVLDALTGVAYAEDSLVYSIVARKFWADGGPSAFTLVSIEWDDCL